MNKIRDEYGNVAVLISDSYGSGWSTGAFMEDSEGLLFDGAIVNMVLAKADGWKEEITAYCAEKYPEFYCRPRHLDIDWVAPGKPFVVREQDGQEWICYIEELSPYIA